MEPIPTNIGRETRYTLDRIETYCMSIYTYMQFRVSNIDWRKCTQPFGCDVKLLTSAPVCYLIYE